jgi:DNA-binding MarR family transcriptional regulator
MDNEVVEQIVADLFEILPVFHKKLVNVLDEGSREGLSHYHFVILNMLGQLEAPAVSEIGDKISVSRPQMTSMIDKLVSLGLVTRAPDVRDRRIIRISITPAGKKALSRARLKIKLRLRKKLAHLSADDLELFSTALKNIKILGPKID